MRRWLLHLPTAVGTAALLAAALLALWFTPRWQADTAQTASAAQTRLQRLRLASPVVVAKAPDADTALLQALPTDSDAPQRFAALVDQARVLGIRLDSVRQGAAQRLGTGQAMLAAERVPLRLAGSGPYSAWRRFVAQALQDDDALMLDQIRLARPGADSPALAAELQWSLLQRLGPLPGAAGPATQLPTRAGDWPAPGSAGLQAWQGRAGGTGPGAAAPRLAVASSAALAVSAKTLPAAAPDFPYRWIGQLDDGSTPQVLLGNAQRTLALRLGDTLDGRWRLQRGANGALQALALASGDAVAVPGAPSGLQP